MLVDQRAFPRVRDIEAGGREVALRRKGLVPRTLRPIAGTEPRATEMDTESRATASNDVSVARRQLFI
jgi:hypothetical protein